MLNTRAQTSVFVSKKFFVVAIFLLKIIWKTAYILDVSVGVHIGYHTVYECENISNHYVAKKPLG